MHPRLIRTIFLKDLRDAIRDARVLVAILVPLGIGVFYSVVFDDEDISVPTVSVVYSAIDQTALPDALRDAAGGAVRVQFRQVESDRAVETIVRDEDADVGLAIPAGFDRGLPSGTGTGPPLRVVLPHDPTLGAQFIAGLVEPAVRALAGQSLPATISMETLPAPAEDEPVIDRLGLRAYLVLISIVFLVAMIAMLVVPVILAEEAEKKTLDALVLIASFPDVIAGKALVGVAYIAIAVTILLGATRLDVSDPPLFAAAVLTLGGALIGIGLVMAGFFRSANQLNTWSGVVLAPVIGPAFLVGAPIEGPVHTALLLLPTSQGMRLLANATAGERLFDGKVLSFAVIGIWGALAYGLVSWQLARRQR